ncbi:LYR motif-containing protein 4B [Sphaeramia orbicularis]|nr:LYR motif-containing protein 4B-like [Sphaeramia orbicularis]XP_029979357.1 LYR motif-containing protein 4 [Sphaeramia orbicularis]
MMAASSRAQVISLYRCLLRESSKFASYNYRTYALRRVRDAFRAHRTEDDPRTVQQLMEEGRQALGLIQRQVAIGQMYAAQRTVVE